MSKKSSKASEKNLVKTVTLLDRLPKDRKEYLELLIGFTERAMKNDQRKELFAVQLERLKGELKNET
jgi:hypothetical protein